MHIFEATRDPQARCWILRRQECFHCCGAGFDTHSRGAWNTLTVTVPTNAAALAELGVEFTTDATWGGTAYVDAVTG